MFPTRLRREIIFMIVVKLAVLTLLYIAFFSHSAPMKQAAPPALHFLSSP